MLVKSHSFKKQQHKDSYPNALERCLYSFVIKPARFLNPCQFYFIPRVIGLAERCGKIDFNIDRIVTHAKHVTGIDVQSSQNHIVNVSLEDNPLVGKTPKEYLVARLKSFGDKDLNDWADYVDNFQESYTTALKNFTNKVNQGTNIDSLVPNFDEATSELSNNYGLWLSYKYTEEGVYGVGMSVSNKLLDKLGYTVDKFIETAYQGGIPKIIASDEAYTRLSYEIFKSEYCFELKKTLAVINVDLIDSKGDLIPARQKMGSLVKPNSDGSLDVKHYIFFDFPEDSSVKSEKNILDNPDFVNASKEKQRHHIAFLHSSYGYKPEDADTIRRTCKYKDISNYFEDQLKIEDEVRKLVKLC